MAAQTSIEVGRWYPSMPPMLDGETPEQYTDRLTGADGTGRRPFDHPRNRQCSIGWHSECSDRDNSGRCGCPHHEEVANARSAVFAWNERYPAGTAVTLPEAPTEPPTVTTGPAKFQRDPGLGVGQGWPVVPLEGFPNPVKLSWIVPVTPVILGEG